MRLLASADLHGEHDIYEWLVAEAANVSADLIVLAGDLLSDLGTGTIQESQRLDAIQVLEILGRATQPVLYIMGNDDMVELEPDQPSIQSIHGRRVEIGDLSFVGYQYSLPFMAGIHEKREEGIRADLEALEPLVDERTVLVTHSPAFGALDFTWLERHAGSVSLKDLIEHKSPLLHIHGHIHREFGRQGRHLNVAASGQKRAILIDTDTLKHQVLSGPEAAG
jgi:Icc-related predicted phosphoesterase